PIDDIVVLEIREQGRFNLCGCGNRLQRDAAPFTVGLEPRSECRVALLPLPHRLSPWCAAIHSRLTAPISGVRKRRRLMSTAAPTTTTTATMPTENMVQGGSEYTFECPFPQCGRRARPVLRRRCIRKGSHAFHVATGSRQ